MNERESAKVIPLWNRPSTWGICILILLITVAVLNGKPKAQATTATIHEPTPQPVTTQKPETPVIVKPMPNGDSNASNANNNTNKAGGHIINGNGNRVIITNHHHYHINSTAKQPTPAKPTPKQPAKPQSQECEDHMAEHLAQVAKWESMFK